MTTTPKRQPISFGKYLLLDRINIGGMAEVWRAKTFGAGGFERMVAIKRILPNIAEDEEFISMFIDEAKITVQLNHPNIAQIYELSHIANSYFIAMEYVSGKDLRAVFERTRKQGEPAPIPMVCYCMARCCEGMDYAHRNKDRSGRDMNIVHRDVSPQNVLVSYDGEVKVIDFGIAKAAGKATRTQAGILKGKFGYMSPEQVRGLPLDRRSDVFAIGVCLFELLTAERLFVGDSDFSVLEKVRQVDMRPPSHFNRKIPPELERVVLKALAKNVEDRYQYASELAEDLQRFVITSEMPFGRKDLAAFMKTAFAEDVEREQARLAEYADIKPLPGMPTWPEASGASASSASSTSSVPVSGASSQPMLPRASGSIPPPLPRPSLAIPPPVSAESAEQPTNALLEPRPSLPKLPPVQPQVKDEPSHTLPAGASAPVPGAPTPLLGGPATGPPELQTDPLRPVTGPVAAAIAALAGGAPPVEDDPWQAETTLDTNLEALRRGAGRLGAGSAPMAPAGNPLISAAARSASARASPVPGTVEVQPPPRPPASSTGPRRPESRREIPAASVPKVGVDTLREDGVSLGTILTVGSLSSLLTLVVATVIYFAVLRPVPTGYLMIDLPPGFEGRVRLNVNGTEMRETDGALISAWPAVREVKAGGATVMMSADGYETLLEVVDVKQGNEVTQFTPTLKKKGR